MSMSRRDLLLAGGSLAALGGGIGAWTFWPGNEPSPEGGFPPEGWEEYAGTFFGPEPIIADLTKPKVSLIQVPDFEGAFAIWGAVGRDSRGHIWFSAASHNVPRQSGRLFEYNPDDQKVTLRGDILDELARVGLGQPGQQQPKIHTKFCQGEDGHLYFASTDDPPPGGDLTKPPRWGSHFWRLNAGRWEHLRAFEQGTLALAGNGRWMWMLGYPNHTLTQYDCRTGNVRSIEVGSVEGHCSRNLLCDFRGHAYVPRLKMVSSNHAEHTLVEFDESMREVRQHPLPHYQNGAASACHGIIAAQPLADGAIAFTTHAGRLFRLDPARGVSELHDLGWFHPEGKSYASSLFAFSGEKFLVGAAQRENRWVWVCHNLENGKSRELPLDLPLPARWSAEDAFIYGCATRDNQGNCYLVGGFRGESGVRVPVVLKTHLI